MPDSLVRPRPERPLTASSDSMVAWKILSSAAQTVALWSGCDEDLCRTEFPWTPGCRGRAGWFRQIDADLPAQALAGTAGPEGFLQRMELLRPGQKRHQQRQEARVAHPHHVQPDSRHRLRRPLRTPARAA